MSEEEQRDEDEWNFVWLGDDPGTEWRPGPGAAQAAGVMFEDLY